MMARVRWIAELVGVLAVAVAASIWWLPLGIAVAGTYLIIAANSGGDNSSSNSGGE